jgi:hypothetical protein
MTVKDSEMDFEFRETNVPEPHPALRGLEPLIGNWNLKGHLADVDEENITGKTTFSWLPGKFFVQQDAEINFLGTVIKSREIIGYDEAAGSLRSLVYSNLAGEPWPYEWEVERDALTIRVKYGVLDATFTGSTSSFSGAWAPNPGADPAANVAYEIRSERAY